ncbi:MAG: hypothetical protein C0501_18290 [Isosphaera sp.]|nr:hypothetical protein [Isosphaera sp.]
MKYLVATLALAAGPSGAPAQDTPDAVRQSLARALEKRDAKAVREAAAAGRKLLGDRAGVPEVPDKHTPVPAGAKPLTPDEAREAFAPVVPYVERVRWWKTDLDPTKLGHALREPAAVVAGAAAAARAKLDGADKALAQAGAAAEFLLWAQDRAGTGGFPFPAARGVSTAAPCVAAERYLKQAEKDGRLDRVVRNGWAVDDTGDGGLQFDNGECGTALFELYAVTKDKKHLAAAVRAADWAAGRPLVTNWNYNSFSAHLLAAAFEATGEEKYRAAAKEKVLVGVIPGQLPDGQHAGRWADGHNARPAYHYIMLRALARVAAVLPKDDPDRAAVVAALGLGLKARSPEITAKGATTKDKAVEALVLVERAFADDPGFLRDTGTPDAFDALVRLVSAEYRGGRAPLGPREWGLVLERVRAKK